MNKQTLLRQKLFFYCWSKGVNSQRRDEFSKLLFFVTERKRRTCKKEFAKTFVFIVQEKRWTWKERGELPKRGEPGKERFFIVKRKKCACTTKFFSLLKGRGELTKMQWSSKNSSFIVQVKGWTHNGEMSLQNFSSLLNEKG